MLAMTKPESVGGLIGLDGEVMTVETPRQWLALQAKALREQEAADWLKRAKLWAYWPCYLKHDAAGSARRNGYMRRRPRFASLLPGIIFVAARDGSRVSPHGLVQSIPGLMGYMRDGSGHPALLCERDIDIIRRIELDENLPPSPRTAHRFKTGDKVRFANDLYGAWPAGQIERLADDGRISVAVPLLGRVVAILVHPHQIETM